MSQPGSLAACAALLVLHAAPLLSQSAPAAPTPRVPPAEQQVAAAVLPLPEPMRAGTTVLGYDTGLRLVRLREGTNHLICLADDPREDRFHVACYHDSLEPFMARGRELRAQGLAAPAVDSTRNADVFAGRVRMPPVAGLYSLTGAAGSYDPAANAVRGARALFVVYVPFATVESTGIPATPGRGPWLMHPGTPRAHVMITPDM